MAIPRNLANIAPHVNASSTELVVNDGGADLNFRVEGDTDANTLFVDAGNNRVAIGTDSPTYKLDIISGSGNTPAYFGENTTNGTRLGFASTVPASSNNCFVGWVPVGVGGTNGDLALCPRTSTGAAILFYTGSGTPAERARITSGGTLLVGTTATVNSATAATFYNASSANPVAVVQNARNISGDAAFNTLVGSNCDNTSSYHLLCGVSGVANRLYIYGNGDVANANNSYGSISDEKIKQDIVDASSQWDDIKSVRIRKFRFKEKPDGPLQIGVVAQELEVISPGLINESPDFEEVEVPVLDGEGNPVLNEDGTPQTTRERNELGTTTKSVKYSVLYMKAIKALQEAMERIETLEAKVAALEAQ